MPFFAAVAAIVFPDLGTVVLIGITRQAISFFGSLGLWRIYRRWPAADFKLATHAWQIVLYCVLVTLVDAVVAEGARIALGIPPPPDVAQIGSLIVRFAIYLAWSALYFAIRQELERHATELRLARAEAANREAELQLLRAQVNPHFLFNALNALIGYAETNPGEVVNTTHAIADYLRYSLSHGSHRAPLGHELDAMAGYLLIAAAHHSLHGLDWNIEATDEARHALAPTALVQPLVENAIKYGLPSSPPPLRLRVTALAENGFLVVAVENSGRWLEPGSAERKQPSTGIGLNNVRRRLELLCGERAALNVTTPPGFVRVEARLPFEQAASGT